MSTKDLKHKVNDEIAAEKVVLIDKDGKNLGIVDRQEALSAAEDAGMDLVQMNPLPIPVAKVMDHGKFIFNKTAKQKKQKSKRTGSLKEMKIYAKIAEADYQVKLKNINNFLAKGNNVKIIVFLKGRERRRPQIALDFLIRMLENIQDFALISSYPKLEDPLPFYIIIGRKKQ